MQRAHNGEEKRIMLVSHGESWRIECDDDGRNCSRANLSISAILWLVSRCYPSEIHLCCISSCGAFSQVTLFDMDTCEMDGPTIEI